MTEVWKPISGYEGLYEISNLGRVKSLERTVKNGHGGRVVQETILKICKTNRRYSGVGLSKNRELQNLNVHRLVAIAFVSNPENKPMVNHINGVRYDNRADNLEWTTAKENIQHAWSSGICNSDYCKKKVMQIKDGKIIKVWESQHEISRCLNISQGNISACCIGKRKTASGFQWKSAD